MTRKCILYYRPYVYVTFFQQQQQNINNTNIK
jgi:hypothetical protein